MKNNSVLAEDAPWRTCKPGELLQLSAQQRRRGERRALLRGLSLAVAGCAAAGVVGFYWVSQREQPFAPGGLVCGDVTRLLPSFVAKQLDAKRTEQVMEHLASCEHCTEMLKKLQLSSSARGAHAALQKTFPL